MLFPFPRGRPNRQAKRRAEAETATESNEVHLKAGKNRFEWACLTVQQSRYIQYTLEVLHTTWKMVVGRLLSHWVPGNFQGRTVKLRWGTVDERNPAPNWYVVYLIVYMVLCIPGGCLGFQPSTVLLHFQTSIRPTAASVSLEHDPRWWRRCFFEVQNRQSLRLVISSVWFWRGFWVHSSVLQEFKYQHTKFRINTSFFNVTLRSPKWRSLNFRKGHLRLPNGSLGRTW